jgi:Uma2 family endonuclease
MSVNVVVHEAAVSVPSEACRSLAAFREWRDASGLPEKARVDYYQGAVWVAMGCEQLFTHGLLNTEIARVLWGFVKAERLGYYWCNGVSLINVEVDLFVNPDGTFVSLGSVKKGLVELVEGADDGYVELRGTPDMILEVVSDGSVVKDTVTLRQAYWEAGVAEYWLADARTDRLEFQILKHGPKGYTETRKPAGWVRSQVFGRSFKLVREKDALGNPSFSLLVRK